MNKLLMTIASCLLVTLTLTTATPAMADGGALIVFFTVAGLISTSTSSGRHRYDAVKAQSLIDQAYAGAGEKLEVLSSASNKPVETIADTIVALDKDGKIDANQPEQMAQTIAAAIK